MKPLVVLVATLLSTHALAEEDLYDVTTDGTTTALKAGAKGTFVIAFRLKPGVHVSDEAPMKIELSSPQATLAKKSLTLADAKKKGEPRFEVGFTAKGSTSIDAKLTFFVCTESSCLRQTKSLSVPVEVQ
jgi:hypothetical protein